MEPAPSGGDDNGPGGIAGVFRKWSFTLAVLGAVTIGMVWPTWFIGYGDFKYTRLFVPLLQIIMFCMGTTLSYQDFARVLRMPKAVCIGLACQFTIMPLLGYLLAHAPGIPQEVGAGIILVGASPSGLASNVMSYIAKADVAMSVTMTALATLMAPILTPLFMKYLAGQLIEVDAAAMMWDISKIVLFPVAAGLIFHHSVYQHIRWLERVMPLFSMAGIIAMTVLTVAVGRDNLLRLGLYLVLLCAIHNLGGYLLGYWASRALRLDRIAARTIAIEVGMQNAGLASGIAATLNKVGTLGLAPILFGPIMNTSASILANWWRTRPADKTQ